MKRNEEMRLWCSSSESNKEERRRDDLIGQQNKNYRAHMWKWLENLFFNQIASIRFSSGLYTSLTLSPSPVFLSVFWSQLWQSDATVICSHICLLQVARSFPYLLCLQRWQGLTHNCCSMLMSSDWNPVHWHWALHRGSHSVSKSFN